MLGYLIICKPVTMWIVIVIDTVPSNQVHVEYRLVGEVLSLLHDVNSCLLEEFLVRILDHVDR